MHGMERMRARSYDTLKLCSCFPRRRASVVKDILFLAPFKNMCIQVQCVRCLGIQLSISALKNCDLDLEEETSLYSILCKFVLSAVLVSYCLYLVSGFLLRGQKAKVRESRIGNLVEFKCMFVLVLMYCVSFDRSTTHNKRLIFNT